MRQAEKNNWQYVIQYKKWNVCNGISREKTQQQSRHGKIHTEVNWIKVIAVLADWALMSIHDNDIELLPSQR